MAGEFLGHDEVDVAAAEAGDEEDAVGVEVGDAVGGGVGDVGRRTVGYV